MATVILPTFAVTMATVNEQSKHLHRGIYFPHITHNTTTHYAVYTLIHTLLLTLLCNSVYGDYPR